MNLYRVIVLREGKEYHIERGVWADRMELQGESILFLSFDKDTMSDRITGLYPARFTIVTSVESKEEFDKRKSSL